MGELNPSKFVIQGYRLKGDDENVRPIQSFWKSVFRKFFSSKVAILAMTFLLIIILMIIFGPKFTDASAYEVYGRNLKPSLKHFFGTNELGWDIFCKMWIGGRTSFLIGISVAVINTTLGIIYGTICGYFGGLTDDIIMRITEIILCIPNLIVIMLIGMIMQAGVFSAIISMSVVGWCTIARLVRGQVLLVKQQEFVLAAQALGASSSRVVTKHLLTNILSVTIVTITLEIPYAILAESLLGFLGFLDTGTLMTWGKLMKSVQNSYIFYPYQTLIPGAVISVVLICFNLIGDVLSDALNPKLS